MHVCACMYVCVSVCICMYVCIDVCIMLSASLNKIFPF